MKPLLCFAMTLSMGRGSRPQIILSPQACICCAVMVLIVPSRWLLAWFFAAFCHESFHCLALLLSGRQIHSIQIGAFGMQIGTNTLNPIQSVYCALAGPLAGIILVLFAKFVPRIAICAFLQSVCNLLPIYPLDGSVALRGFLQLLFSEERTDRICRFLEILIFTTHFACCAYAAWVWKLGNLPLLFATVFLIGSLKRKIPCKYGLYRVQ